VLVSCAVAESDEAHPIQSGSTRMLWDMPMVEQTTNYTCGAAAMQGVLAYYGFSFTEDFLAKELGSTPKDGTDHVKMVEYAVKLGLQAEVKSNLTLKEVQSRIEKGDAVIAEAQAWQDDKPSAKPYPETWNSGHYMIVIGVDEKNVYFVDPSAGLKRGYIPVEEFMPRWHDTDMKNQKLYQTAILFKGTPKPVILPFGWMKVP
jgi:predicted double-glycine peptidase